MLLFSYYSRVLRFPNVLKFLPLVVVFHYQIVKLQCAVVFWIPLRWGVLDTTLCDKVCQWLATGPPPIKLTTTI